MASEVSMKESKNGVYLRADRFGEIEQLASFLGLDTSKHGSQSFREAIYSKMKFEYKEPVKPSVADTSESKSIAEWRILKAILDSKPADTLEFGKIKNAIVKKHNDNEIINFLITETSKYLESKKTTTYDF
jgi:hypothetical protein